MSSIYSFEDLPKKALCSEEWLPVQLSQLIQFRKYTWNDFVGDGAYADEGSLGAPAQRGQQDRLHVVCKVHETLSLVGNSFMNSWTHVSEFPIIMWGCELQIIFVL